MNFDKIKSQIIDELDVRLFHAFEHEIQEMIGEFADYLETVNHDSQRFELEVGSLTLYCSRQMKMNEFGDRCPTTQWVVQFYEEYQLPNEIKLKTSHYSREVTIETDQENLLGILRFLIKVD